MKIALLGPVAWRTPPLHYGPWEQTTRSIAEREIVDVGETGYLAGGAAEAVGCIDRAVALDRAAIRWVAERRFSVDRMVDDYLAVYRRILDRSEA